MAIGTAYTDDELTALLRTSTAGNDSLVVGYLLGACAAREAEPTPALWAGLKIAGGNEGIYTPEGREALNTAVEDWVEAGKP